MATCTALSTRAYKRPATLWHSLPVLAQALVPHASQHSPPKHLPHSHFMSTMADTTTTTTTGTAADDTFNPRFLVVSLGNPPPHAESLHSAGHLANQSLRQQLHRQSSQPNFSSERIAKKATQTSRGDKYMLVQCPTLMNVSGPWVAKAWKEYHAAEAASSSPLGLIVLHDELEEDVGVVKIRKWDRSHRGHNGLKSIMASLRATDYNESKFAKVSIGIGRPVGRDPKTVSDFVLKPWSKHTKETLFAMSGPGVLAAIEQIEAAWKSDKEKGVSDDSDDRPAKKSNKTRPNAKARDGA